jgi:hypothetical protein
VLSSSLHGVVVAHSLGVPVQLVLGSSSHKREPSWKYHDYFDSMDTELTTTGHDRLHDKAHLDLVFQRREAEAPRLADVSAELAEQLIKALGR